MNPELATKELAAKKIKHPAALAWKAANEMVEVLTPCCEPGRIVVAGSLRRGKPQVGDIEIVFVPKFETRAAAGDMFGSEVVNWAARHLLLMLDADAIAYRWNKRGHTTWGEQIKLAVHVETNVPVDFFTSTEESWWNYLVCRTGPAESNLRIATAARALGWKWEPYSSGFMNLGDPNERKVVRSEREVFEFVGLPYEEPEGRR